jgi:hypothetical protein
MSEEREPNTEAAPEVQEPNTGAAEQEPNTSAPEQEPNTGAASSSEGIVMEE